MSSDRVFLRSVAQYYCKVNTHSRFSDITFVLPNKRAAGFLKKYMRAELDAVTMMPRFMTMRTFLDILSERPEGSSIQLLFTLYDAYRNVLKKLGRHSSTREFDSFIFWGDMMLSDFDDIDKTLANADSVFKNIRDIKDIVTDYLSDEQKEVIRRVWGESRLTTCITEFWAHLSEDAPEDSVSRKFLYLWEIMADIYKEFHRLLELQQMASAGTQYKTAVDNSCRLFDEDSAAPMHYAFVGFNDLSKAETLIFDRLRKSAAASFFWDTAPLSLFRDSEGLPESLRRLKRLVRNFPAPEDFEPGMPDGLPEVTVTAVPSNVAQTKAAGDTLLEWYGKGYLKDSPMNTAIVMPDKGLLLPMLMAVPEEISAVNISMSLPFRTTNFAILLHSIISMQLRARRRAGAETFFYADVLQVLQHPHIQAIAAEDADRVSTYISEGKVYNVEAAEIIRISPRLAPVFTPLAEDNDARKANDYLCGLLDWIGQELQAISGGKPTSEINAISYFLSELDRLTRLVEEHKVTMENHTFLQLFERIFSSRDLDLSGKPLEGLQILGVLETRALDFDNVIVLSMNDGVFPRKQYTHTMIPNNLRNGYDLPDFNSLEWTYSYSFFRLLSRAKRVAIFYDSRSDGKGQGERSRYITQMRYLVPELKIQERQLNVGQQTKATGSFEIKKTPAVMKELAQFKPGGRLKVSATALKEYLQCPFSFYLKYVRGMRGSDEMVNYLTSANYGTIVHNTIQELFKPFRNQLVGREQYDRWLASAPIESIVTDQLMGIRQHPSSVRTLNAEENAAKEAICAIVRADLTAERDKYGSTDFTFVENEYKVDTIEDNTEWKIDDELSINFYMSIDRLDRLSDGHLRFIDFKTGREDTFSKEMEGVFKRGDSAKHGLFQILTYCEAYKSIIEPDADIVPLIHPMRMLTKGEGIPDISIGSNPVTSYNKIRDTFRPQLHALLKDIFGPEKSFTQCENTKNNLENVCSYCKFVSLCGRYTKD